MRGEEIYFWPLKRPPLGAGIWLRALGTLQASDALRGEWISRFYSIHLVITGHGVLEREFQSHEIRQGDLVCYWPGVKIVLHPDAGDPWVRHWIQLDGEGAREYAESLGFGARHPVVHAHHFARARQIFQKLLEQFRTHRTSQEPHVLALLFEFASACGSPKEGAPMTDPVKPEDPGFVGRLFAAMEKTGVSHPGIAEAARMLGMSRTTLYRECIRQVRMSPSRYLDEMRLSQARELLLRSREKIASIARALEFHDDKYFLRWFRKQTGVTPTQYRTQALGPDLPERPAIPDLRGSHKPSPSALPVGHGAAGLA